MALVAVAAAVATVAAESIVVVAVGTAAVVVVIAICSLRPMDDETAQALVGFVVVTDGFLDASVLTTIAIN